MSTSGSGPVLSKGSMVTTSRLRLEQETVIDRLQNA
jgi:hypothetical protein